ncbi:EamA family transporter [Caballeronia sp. NK8]|uniref:EamA family transporter n=1 Tax=Caballeronia sp. NK8 TaxID=140098 RepID=UPI001BCFB351|nr:EamA family transporter [Caballeronia sp. NK8]
MKLNRLDLLLGILVTILWGCNFTVIEVGLKSLDPFVLTFLRFLCCAFPAVFFIPRPRNVATKFIAAYGFLFGVGLWWVVNFAMYNGLSAGTSSVFLQFSAFFTIILSRIFFKERILILQVVGILIALVGLVAFAVVSNLQTTTIGIGLVLFAALSWATCNMIVKLTKPADMISFIVWSSLFSAPAILALTLMLKGATPFIEIQRHITMPAAFSVFFQAYITTILGYMVWNNLMKKYPSTQVAPLSLLVPISGILSSYLFLGETLSRNQTFSTCATIFGIGLFMNAARIRAALPMKRANLKP